MTYGSLFSGAGGFDMGMDDAGIECAWQVEIDRTASSVLARHWPTVPRSVDVRECGKRNLAPVDVLVGGFPCQDLSLAGERAGLAGDRSGLWWEMLRIVDELRPGCVVFENVPGLRTSDAGRDFWRVLSSLAEHGYFGCVRTLDARNFGVPQSRQRLFGVFARGHSGAERACQILAVREGLRGHPPASGQTGEDIAYALAASVGRNSSGNRIGNGHNTTFVPTVAACVRSNQFNNSDPSQEARMLVVFGGNDTSGEREVATAINAKGGTGRIDFETENFVIQPFVFESKKAGEGSDDVAPTLRALGHDKSHANAGGQLAVAYRTAGDGAVYECGDTAAPLTTATDPSVQVVQQSTGVRRLTPRECERLMGWPDDWTRWREDGTEIKDGPRYRMIGNGVAKPCALWLGRRIRAEFSRKESR